MKALVLRDYQLKAINQMKNGCILCGDVGSGKSLTALSYYYLLNGGDVGFLSGGKYAPMTYQPSKQNSHIINRPFLPLYIITTARKRDTLEWESEMAPFLLSTHEGMYPPVVVDSWNNIGKYVKVTNSFFIFDEQRVVGSGAWVKSFYKIASANKWILLSATPGDKWDDYIPVFVANGFYRNKTDFFTQHITYPNYQKCPWVKRYLNQGKLMRCRDAILVDMDFKRQTVQHHEYLYCDYDTKMYRDIMRYRVDPFSNEPIVNGSQFCLLLRKVVNSSDDRQIKLLEIFEKHPRLIIFYNHDYELEILRALYFGDDVVKAEWNGHKHEDVPKTEKWVYFVQYNAGAEAWNCITTDTMVFFSQSYSYRTMKQSSGRIDRMNTPYHDLYYYHLSSKSPIDISIARAIADKKTFNESRFVNRLFKEKN